MIGLRRDVSGHQLLGVVRAAFGKRWLESVRKLTGGARKGVYRLTLDNGRTAVAYVWHPDWPDAAGDLDRFVNAHERLTSAGVRVPEIIMLDRSGTFVDGDVAVVEDIPGDSLATVDPARAEPALRELAQAIRTMHGQVATHATRAEDLVLSRALDHLAESAARMEPIAAVRDRLAELLRTRHAAIPPRTEHRLIHGSLTPDHVLLTEDDHPVLINIETTTYFDVEWEHAWLESHFGAAYHHFATPQLDERRLRLYRLALSLSLVAIPLRRLDTDIPDRSALESVVYANVERTLAILLGSDVDRAEFAE